MINFGDFRALARDFFCGVWSMKNLPSFVIDLILGIGLFGVMVLLVLFGSEAQTFVYAMF
jgi:hypothetical protein